MGAVVPERPLDPAEPARRLGLGWCRRSGSAEERGKARRGGGAGPAAETGDGGGDGRSCAACGLGRRGMEPDVWDPS